MKLRKEEAISEDTKLRSTVAHPTPGPAPFPISHDICHHALYLNPNEIIMLMEVVIAVTIKKSAILWSINMFGRWNICNHALHPSNSHGLLMKRKVKEWRYHTTYCNKYSFWA